MTCCTNCGLQIHRWQKYHRTKKGAHHAECPEPHGLPTIRSLAEASHNITAWLQYELETLEDFGYSDLSVLNDRH